MAATDDQSYIDPALLSPVSSEMSSNMAAMDDQSPTEGDGDGNHDRYKPLYRAVFNGDWEAAKRFLDLHPEALTASISEFNQRALHIAAMAGHVKVVEELVKLIPAEDLALTDNGGATALHHIACTGIVKLAECMVKKNTSLVCTRYEGDLPILYASSYGHKDMARYLYTVTPKIELSPDQKGSGGVTLLNSFISTDNYDLALDLLQDHPELVFAGDFFRRSALMILGQRPSAFKSGSRFSFWQRWIYSCIRVQSTGCPSKIQGEIESSKEGQGGRKNIIIQFPGIQHIHDTKLKHFQALELLHRILKSLSESGSSKLEKSRARFAILDAVEHGIVEFVAEIIKIHPPLIWSLHEGGRHIFMNAIVYRQEKIFSLLYKLGALRTRLVTEKDNFGNNMLHLSGMLAPPCRLDQVSGAALQLQRELQWFKEVEDIVLPKDRETTNDEDKTARTLFTEEHVDLLKAGEKWMKGTATSCMFVATLIATVMFAAAFTIPGGSNEDTGIPLLLHLNSIKVFIISDALSLFSSSTSVLMFLVILTSRYAEEDFLKSLPQKLIFGLSTLLFSMVAMVAAFGSALIAMVTERLLWITIPITFFACVPISLFALLQFRLLVEIFLSTYGSGIFNKQAKHWSY